MRSRCSVLGLLITVTILFSAELHAAPPLPERQPAAMRVEALFRAARIEEAVAAAEAAIQDTSGGSPEAAARAYSRLAGLLADLGRYAEGEANARYALAIIEDALGKDHPAAAESLNILAAIALDRSQLGEAEALLTRAALLARGAGEPGRQDLAEAEAGFAMLFYLRGENRAAEPHVQQAIVIQESAVPVNERRLAQMLDRLGGILAAEQRFAEADFAMRRARAIRERILAPDHPQTATGLLWASSLLKQRNRLDEAEAPLLAAVDSLRRVMGPRDILTAYALTNLAMLRHTQNRMQEAEQGYRDVLGILEPALGERSGIVVNILLGLARIEATSGRRPEAELTFARAIGLFEAIYGAGTRTLPGIIAERGSNLWTLERFKEATEVYERALALAEKIEAPNDRERFDPLVSLTALYYTQARYQDAERVVLQAIEVKWRLGPDDDQGLSVLRRGLADIYREQRRLREAEALYLEVLAAAETRYGENHAQTASIVGTLASVYQVEGRYRDSEAYFRRLIGINTALYGESGSKTAQSLRSYTLLKIRMAHFAEAGATLVKVRAAAEMLGDKAFQADVFDTAAQLSQAVGQYEEAETLMRRAVALSEELSGRDGFDMAVPLSNLANILVTRGKYQEAAALSERSVSLWRTFAGERHPLYGTMLANLSSIYDQMGRLKEAEDLVRQALPIFENRTNQQSWVREKLAALYSKAGRHKEAIEIQRQVAADIETSFGPEHPSLATSLGNLGGYYLELGQFSEAEAAFTRELAIREKVFGPDHPDIVFSLANLASLRGAQGRTSETEKLHRRGIAIRESKLGPEHPDTAHAYSNFGAHLYMLGRNAESETFLRRALAIFEQKLGREHTTTLWTMASLANVLDTIGGHKAESEALHRTGLVLREKVFGPDHPELAYGLTNLATFYIGGKQYQEALPLLRRALTIYEARLGEDHRNTAFALSQLGVALLELDRVDEAAEAQERARAIREKVLPPDHPAIAESLGYIAAVAEKRGDLPGAYAAASRATAILLERTRRRGAAIQLEEGSERNEILENSNTLLRQVRIGFAISGREPARADALMEESFTLAQWPHRSAAGMALAQMSARLATGEGELSALVRRRQDLLWRYQALDKLLVEASAKPAAVRNAEAEKGLREESRRIEETLGGIDADLAKRFPDYAALANPEPLTVAAVQAVLRDDEALYQILVGQRNATAWVVTKTEARWAELPITKDALSEEVDALRCGLDETAWLTDTPEEKARAQVCRTLLGGRGPSTTGWLPFDLARAHRLYETLFGPFKDLIGTRHLLVVPSGPLSTLPIHVLVTEPPAPDADLGGYAKAAWFAKRQPISVLPSVASLKAGRAADNGAPAAHPFISFSNPLLAGKDGTDRRAWKRQTCAAADTELEQVTRSINPPGEIAEVYSDAIADPERIRRQTPLPETAGEACAVGRDLGAKEADIYLGERANEAQLKALSADGTLRGYRVLHFATHGLVAGETSTVARDLSEPSLILTPPDKATETNDGLLTASEIAGLSLNAEAVVLSACNTASASGAPNAEALSGLGRAFFYAGARALLVTHWYVTSDAAVELVTTSFAERKSHPEINLAEALRRAMQASIDRGGVRAHPAWWAPFVVVAAH
jgi:tetratricopeptide (TPR) repeat protein/CHAT domain-containing protein